MNRADFLVLTGAAAAAAPGGAGAPVPGGQTYYESFRTAPFPHPSRAAGYTYEGKTYDFASHYDDSTVGIFVPDGLKDTAAGTDFVVHFHGWNNDVRTVFARYRLREQLVSSGRNAILLVPQGPKDAPDSGDGKLELDPDGFKRFMADVAGWLHRSGIIRNTTVGRIVLSSHSGGYGGEGGVLTRGGMNDHITDVLLFDAAYGYYDAFADWVKAAPGRHLLSLFTGDTSTGNTALMGKVQAPQPNIYVRLADSMTLAQLQTRAPTFVLTTSVAHDDLLQQYDWYSLFLQATALSPR